MKRLMTAEEVRELVEEGACELVDVREAVEFAGSRVAGSRHVPLGELGDSCEHLPGNKAVVLMCRSGKRSAKAAEILRDRGFENISELEGGIMAWEAAGLDTERDERAPWALERQVRLAAGLLILTGLVGSLFWAPAAFLAWFVGAGLVFAGLTDWCGMGMLLAKAPWNRRRSGSQDAAACCAAKEA